MHFCAGLPIILVGCKKDLRRDPRVIEELRKTNQRPVTPEEVRPRSPLAVITLLYPFPHHHPTCRISASWQRFSPELESSANVLLPAAVPRHLRLVASTVSCFCYVSIITSVPILMLYSRWNV